MSYLGFFDWDSASFAILKDQLGAKSVIFMHGTIPGDELKSEDLKKIRPGLIFFNKPMESITSE